MPGIPYKRPRGGLFTGGGLEWLQNLDLSETDRLGVDTHLAKLVFLRGRIARYEKRVAEIARDDPRARLIMTIPGIGYITAVTILAEIVDHGRFASAEKLVSYAGLSPRHHNSGETVRTGGITKRGSVWLRTAMVEAAFVAVRHDARIGARYQKLAARIGSMKARVATARVMLEWVWEMLNSGTEYRGINRDLVKRKMQKTSVSPSPGVTPSTSVRGVSPPLHRRGAAQRPLPFPPAAKNSVGSSRPARAARRGSRRHTGTSRVFNRLPAAAGGATAAPA